MPRRSRRRPPPSALARAQAALASVPTYAWVGAAAVVGVVYLATRPRLSSGSDFEQAMLEVRRGDGEFFGPWIVMWRAGLVRSELRVGDDAWNRSLIEGGLIEAGMPAHTGWTADFATRELCTVYKLKANAGELRELPTMLWSQTLKDYAGLMVTTWEGMCRQLGVNVRPVAP